MEDTQSGMEHSLKRGCDWHVTRPLQSGPNVVPSLNPSEICMTVRGLGSILSPLLVLAACKEPAREPTAPDNPALSRQDEAGVRFATFNASLNRAAEGQLISDLSNPDITTRGTTQARNAAEPIQRNHPDLIL